MKLLTTTSGQTRAQRVDRIYDRLKYGTIGGVVAAWVIVVPNFIPFIPFV